MAKLLAHPSASSPYPAWKKGEAKMNNFNCICGSPLINTSFTSMKMECINPSCSLSPEYNADDDNEKTVKIELPIMDQGYQDAVRNHFGPPNNPWMPLSDLCNIHRIVPFNVEAQHLNGVILSVLITDSTGASVKYVDKKSPAFYLRFDGAAAFWRLVK